MPDAILSTESLELLAIECWAILSNYLLRNSMGRENGSQLLNGLHCSDLLHYFNIHSLRVGIHDHQVHEGTCKVKIPWLSRPFPWMK